MELAVGVTRQTITPLEVGKYTASLILAYKIAHYFGLTIEKVFDFSEMEGQIMDTFKKKVRTRISVLTLLGNLLFMVIVFFSL